MILRLQENWSPVARAKGSALGTDSSRVTIEITPADTGCDLVLTHELHPAWADYKERTSQAWTKMLDALAGAL